MPADTGSPAGDGGPPAGYLDAIKRQYWTPDDMNPAHGGRHPHSLGAEFTRMAGEDAPQLDDLVKAWGMISTGGAEPDVEVVGEITPWQQKLQSFQAHSQRPNPRLPEMENYPHVVPAFPSLEAHMMRAWRQSPSPEMYEAIRGISKAAKMRPPWERVPRVYRGS